MMVFTLFAFLALPSIFLYNILSLNKKTNNFITELIGVACCLLLVAQIATRMNVAPDHVTDDMLLLTGIYGSFIVTPLSFVLILNAIKKCQNTCNAHSLILHDIVLTINALFLWFIFVA